MRTQGSETPTDLVEQSYKDLGFNHQKSNSVQISRPHTCIIETRRFASIEKDKEEAYDLKCKLKSQNYHISGPNHASIDRSLSASHYSNPRRTLSNDFKNSQQQFRTSFQESFTQKLLDN